MSLLVIGEKGWRRICGGFAPTVLVCTYGHGCGFVGVGAVDCDIHPWMLLLHAVGVKRIYLASTGVAYPMQIYEYGQRCLWTDPGLFSILLLSCALRVSS